MGLKTTTSFYNSSSFFVTSVASSLPSRQHHHHLSRPSYPDQTSFPVCRIVFGICVSLVPKDRGEARCEGDGYTAGGDGGGHGGVHGDARGYRGQR